MIRSAVYITGMDVIVRYLLFRSPGRTQQVMRQALSRSTRKRTQLLNNAHCDHKVYIGRFRLLFECHQEWELRQR